MGTKNIEKIRRFIEKWGDLQLLNEEGLYGGYLDLRGTGITSLPEGLTVGGSLDLSGTGITSLPEGLTVSGSLDLSGTGITSLPEGLTVGGALYLRGTGITSLPEGLTVSGSLDLSGTGITDTSRVNRKAPSVYFWRWRDRSFIKADGVFQQIINRHGNLYKVRRIGRKEETWLITDGAGRWAHGDTIQEARRDLLYKIANRDTSRYKGLTADSELSFQEAIEAYRVITGACAAGTRNFVENILPESEKKPTYTIAEIIELTKGHFGANTFAEFFKK